MHKAQAPACEGTAWSSSWHAAPGSRCPRRSLASPPQLVFTEVALGAVVLTVNVILLGGDIVFFQSMCLIGYCLFPINIAAIVCLFVKMKVRGPRRCGGALTVAGLLCGGLVSAVHVLRECAAPLALATRLAQGLRLQRGARPPLCSGCGCWCWRCAWCGRRRRRCPSSARPSWSGAHTWVQGALLGCVRCDLGLCTWKLAPRTEPLACRARCSSVDPRLAMRVAPSQAAGAGCVPRAAHVHVHRLARPGQELKLLLRLLLDVACSYITLSSNTMYMAAAAGRRSSLWSRSWPRAA